MQSRKRLHFSFISATKKSVAFLYADKNATFFVKLTLHEKSRYARQKVLTDIFDGYNPIASGVLPPSRSPAARMSSRSSTVFWSYHAAAKAAAFFFSPIHIYNMDIKQMHSRRASGLCQSVRQINIFFTCLLTLGRSQSCFSSIFDHAYEQTITIFAANRINSCEDNAHGH